MKKNNKISDELLIAYLENELSKEQRKSLEGVLHSDDKIYLRYRSLSFTKSEEARLEVTPDTLLSKALPLKQYTKSKAMKEEYWTVKMIWLQSLQFLLRFNIIILFIV